MYVTLFSEMLDIQLSLKIGSRYSLFATIAFPIKLNVCVHLWKFNLEAFVPLPTNKMHAVKRFFRDECNSELKNSWIYHILLLFLIREKLEERHWKQNQFAALDLAFRLVTIWLLGPNYPWGNKFSYLKAISPIDNMLTFLSFVCVVPSFFLWNIVNFRVFLHWPFKQDLQSEEHFLYTTKLLFIPVILKQIRNCFVSKTPEKRCFGLCSIPQLEERARETQWPIWSLCDRRKMTFHQAHNSLL